MRAIPLFMALALLLPFFAAPALAQKVREGDWIRLDARVIQEDLLVGQYLRCRGDSLEIRPRGQSLHRWIALRDVDHIERYGGLNDPGLGSYVFGPVGGFVAGAFLGIGLVATLGPESDDWGELGSYVLGSIVGGALGFAMGFFLVRDSEGEPVWNEVERWDLTEGDSPPPPGLALRIPLSLSR